MAKTISIVNKIISASNDKDMTNVFIYIDKLYDYVGYNIGEQILNMIDEVLYNAIEL